MGQGTHLYAAAEIRKAVSIPVVSGGRVLTGEFADQAIDDGKVDMVFVARALIADSQWTAKVRDGQTAEIRACIGRSGRLLHALVPRPGGGLYRQSGDRARA